MTKKHCFCKVTAAVMAAALCFQVWTPVSLKKTGTTGMIVANAEETAAPASTEAAGTTQAAAATTEAVTKDSGFGVAILNGEEMTLDFASTSCIYIPITVNQKGYLNIIRHDVSSENVTISVVGADKVTELVKETVESEEDTGAFAIAEGSYFIKAEADMGNSFVLSAKVTTGVEMTSGKKTSVVLEKHTAKTKYYMEITANSTGLMTLENMGSASVKVTLCNSNKKALSSAKTLEKYSSKNHKDNKNSEGYGVKKGQHYLVCITAAASVKKVTLKYTIKSYSNVGGSSLSKAVSLKMGKTIGGTLAAGSKSSYYKFTKSSYSQKKVTLKTFCNQGNITVYLYYKEVKGKNKGKILPVKVNGKHIGWTQKAEYKNTLKIPSNWPKVTYYLKISNSNSKSSGSYQLMVK